VTADDFGLAVAVNEAIEQAHKTGVLTTASLMVGAEAASDAIARARRLPSLRVGLHLVVVCGRPTLSPDRVPDLVGPDGRFSNGLTRVGLESFFRPAVRRQLKAEIRAQFSKFDESGLRLDHVNAHKHMHLHPTVLSLILEVGRDFGLKALRLPYEPFAHSWRATREGFLGRLWAEVFLAPWLGVMRRRIGRSGLRRNDYLFGMHDSGRMREERVLNYLGNLPQGVSEIYFHPAVGSWSDVEPPAADYLYEQELGALISPKVAAAIHSSGIEMVTFGDLRD
jgi:hopanoid biosynthesis associated protein HpnK